MPSDHQWPFHNLHFIVLTCYTCFFLLAVSFTSLYLFHLRILDVKALLAGPFSHSIAATSRTCHYPGWAGLQHLIIFGDSYTDTGFNSRGTQPSRGNPFGNPEYPGHTSSNGPNWVGFLTTTWNSSFLETVDFGYGGACVDGDLVKQSSPEVQSLKQQVEEQYLPLYSQDRSLMPWSSNDTLFAFFFGINDIFSTFAKANETLYETIFEVYAGLVDTIYQTGARNFLFLYVPPIDRSPATNWANRTTAHLYRPTIKRWNDRVAEMSRNLTNTYTDATTFVFDTFTLYDKVLDDPSSYAETAELKDQVNYCVAYEQGTMPDWYAKIDNCPYRVDEYFWLNLLHPGFRIHNATAGDIAKQIGDPC